MLRTIIVVVILATCIASIVEARGGGRRSSSRSRSYSYHYKPYKSYKFKSKRAIAKVPKSGAADNYRDSKGILRDSKTGKIYRSKTAVLSFRKDNPCPSTGKTVGACPGYQIDHRVALENGGSDAPDNMQWLSLQEHQAKTIKDNAASQLR